MTGIDTNLVESGVLLHGVLQSSSDCIKVLDLDARLVFMSAGGLEVMEVDDFKKLAGCSWLDFWKGEKEEDARAAIAVARAGGLGRFQGWCRTAKGTPKWWDVQVTSINDQDGRPQQLLAISRDLTEIKRAEESQQLLVSEMRHRVNNLLAVVQAIANQTFRDDGLPLSNARQSFSERLLALSRTHDILQKKSSEAVGLHGLISGVLAPYDLTSSRVSLEGPELQVTGRQALPLTLVLHELTTNATKYGALSNDNGHLAICWRIAAGAPSQPRRLVLNWTEAGGPVVEPPTRKGFGSRLITYSAADLGGALHIAYEPSGLRCTLDMPIDDSESGTAPGGSDSVR
ncbi:MAG: PAS domain-containing protein [Rhizobiales bacterium]|nr:PAS domain-containing protein [Hyphomicrobiales bacterium]